MKVNAESCIGCGTCESICPSVFKIDDEKGYAEAIVDEILEEDIESATDAMEGCPTNAIEEVQNDDTQDMQDVEI